MGNRNFSRNRSERGNYPSSGYGRDREFGQSSGYGYRGDDEPYFGSGRQQYGQGYSSEPYSGFGERGQFGSRFPSERGYSEQRGYSGGGYSGSEGRQGDWRSASGSQGRSSGYEGSYGTSSYGGGYQSDTNYPNRSRHSGESGGMYGRSNSYGSNYENYPNSESGYTSRGYNQDDRGWWDKTADEVSSWFGDDEAARRREMDYRREGYEGQHRGRGPKGYTRSDDRIQEDINDRLTDFDYLDASDIEVKVEQGDVVLSGTVDSRYEKRLAEDLAEAVSGVKNVENRIRVSSSWSDSSTRSTSGTSTAGTSSTSLTDTTTSTGKTKTATSRS
ncbi:MAG: BON domain-containing protein [Pyrinomonadaceae bacterium]|nr:BON domain-containing protein [Pyrinomonadaceae bacterium]